MEREVSRAARQSSTLSIAFLDLDNFKSINNSHGHLYGSRALVETAAVIRGSARETDIVARYGGDEFAVLLVNTPKAGAVKYAQRIRNVVERHRFAHGALTVSLGIATLPDDVLAWEDLVPAADRALYTAKRLGRNAIEVA